MQERNLYTKEIFLATIMIVNRIINDFQVANGIYYKKGKKTVPEHKSWQMDSARKRVAQAES